MFLFGSVTIVSLHKGTGLQGFLLWVYVGFIFFFTPIGASAQNKFDNQWVFAKNTLLDFSTQPPSVLFINSPLYSYNNGVMALCANVCDSNGQLLCFTSPVYPGDEGSWDKIGLRNREGDLLCGGSNLFPDINASVQAAMILPGLSNSNSKWVLSFSLDAILSLYSINFSSANPLIANAIVIESVGAYVRYGELDSIARRKGYAMNMDALRHANGKDWWVIVRKNQTSIFDIYLLNEAGLTLHQTVELPGYYPPPALVDGGYIDIGRMLKFSNSGSKFIYSVANGDLLIGDFDRCTGISSNLRLIRTGLSFPKMLDPYLYPEGRVNAWHYGFAFAESDSIIYWNANHKFFQIVLDKELIRIVSFLKLADIRPTHPDYWLGGVERGPDGKIYMAKYLRQGGAPFKPLSDTFASFLSVVNNPNVIGIGCDFQLNGLELPDTQYTEGYLPSMPVYRPWSYVSPKQKQLTKPESVIRRCIGDTVKIGMSISNGLVYRWSPSDGLSDAFAPNPTLNVTTPQNYIVSITDTSSPCTPTIYDTIRVTLRPESECKSTFVFIPNAFTPNGDGINDSWQVNFSIDVLRTQALIFNRWGQEVFRGDPRTGWDGTRASEGVYNYSLSWTDKEGKHTRNGSVTLLR